MDQPGMDPAGEGGSTCGSIATLASIQVSVGHPPPDNGAVPDLESRIDELYQGPLHAFVASRTALARTLKGTDAQRVKALPKPTIVPWVVNQVFWHARELHDRVIQRGEKLRAAEVAALEGRAADVRAATQAHRDAIANAVAKAMQIAAAAGAHPGSDDVARTFEALSLAPNRPGHPGRLAGALTPAGFEALGGIAVKAPPPPPSLPAPARIDQPARVDHSEPEAVRRVQKAREREQAAAVRRKTVAITKAQATVDRARIAEARARERWEGAKKDLETAERSLRTLRGSERPDTA